MNEERKQSYRNAMARLGAAVNIVTTDGAGGLAGFAATAVCSVSDSPPTMLVCLNRKSSAYQAVTTNGVVCVNILESRHQELSQLFGGKTLMSERFVGDHWDYSEDFGPRLTTALASFDCRIKSVVNGETHDILLCEVINVTNNDGGHALIYYSRAYHPIVMDI